MNVKELTDLAIDVTGIGRRRWGSLCETMRSDPEMNRVMREEWHSKPRDSEEAIREYYRSSGIWFVNTFINGVGALVALAGGDCGGLPPWAKIFTEIFRSSGGRVLDFGGGLFKDTWPLVAAGYRVDVAEVGGPVTEFLKKFIALAHLEEKMGVVEVNSEAPLTSIYGGIVCFETLEHVLHPEALVKHLHGHLIPGGPFAFSTTFGAPEHAPYHVASNAPLSDWLVWSGILKKVGFSSCWEDPNGSSTKIWKA